MPAFDAIIAFIEDEEVIEKILKHLGLWEAKAQPPPKVKARSPTIDLDDSVSLVSINQYCRPIAIGSIATMKPLGWQSAHCDGSHPPSTSNSKNIEYLLLGEGLDKVNE